MVLSRILVPTDFSTAAARAADVAVTLAAAVGGTIDLVHVFSLPGVTLPDGSTFPASPAKLVEVTESAETALAEAVRALAVRVHVEVFTRLGSPGDEILQLASSGKYDLVVMGTHGRSGLRRMLMGSVAEEVLRRSPIPVVTVREPLERNETAAPSL